MFAAALAATAENQRVEIKYVHDTATPVRLIWVDPDGPGGQDGDCVDHAIRKMECVAVDAAEIGQHMNESLNEVPGGAIGKVGDGERTLGAIVYRRGYSGRGSYSSELKSIRLPLNWKSSPKGTTHHETGHAFVDKYLPGSTCNGSVRSLAEI